MLRYFTQYTSVNSSQGYSNKMRYLHVCVCNQHRVRYTAVEDCWGWGHHLLFNLPIEGHLLEEALSNAQGGDVHNKKIPALHVNSVHLSSVTVRILTVL